MRLRHNPLARLAYYERLGYSYSYSHERVRRRVVIFPRQLRALILALLSLLVVCCYAHIAAQSSYSRVAVVGSTIYAKIMGRAVGGRVFSLGNARQHHDQEGALIPVSGIPILTRDLSLTGTVMSGSLSEHDITRLSSMTGLPRDSLRESTPILDLDEIMREQVSSAVRIDSTPGNCINYGVLVQSALVRIVYYDSQHNLRSHYCHTVLTDSPPPLRAGMRLRAAVDGVIRDKYQVMPDLTLRVLSRGVRESVFYQLSEPVAGLGLHPFYLGTADPVAVCYIVTRALSQSL